MNASQPLMTGIARASGYRQPEREPHKADRAGQHERPLPAEVDQIHGTVSGATTAPTFAPALKMPVASARSLRKPPATPLIAAGSFPLRPGPGERGRIRTAAASGERAVTMPAMLQSVNATAYRPHAKAIHQLPGEESDQHAAALKAATMLPHWSSVQPISR